MSILTTSLDKHVAALAFPFASHTGSLLGFVRQLAIAAPDVTFSFFSTEKSNRSLVSMALPDNIRLYDVSDGVPEGYVFIGKPQEAIELFLKVAEEEFRRGVAVAAEDTGRRVTCVMTHAFLWFSGEMAEEMGVPWVPLWSAGPCSLSIHVYTDHIRQNVGLSSMEGREDEILNNFIPGFPILRLGDLPDGVLFGNLASPFSNMIHKMGQTLHRATVVPINSFQELDPDLTKDLHTKFNKFLNIGPLNLMSPQPSSPNLDQHGCIPWLERQSPKSVAYISFGSLASLSPAELGELAEALEESGTQFLWSLKDNLKNHLPEGFLKRTSENGKIVPWAPQVQVLAHNSIGVFITHCGWNSVLESIAAGVPIIGRPFFGDQQLNTWMVEKVWKIGVRIEGGVFTKKATKMALDQILSHEEGNKLKEKITVFKELALKAVGPNGSSSENFKSLLEVITI